MPGGGHRAAAAPQDDIDKHLRQLLHVRHASGELEQEVALWQLRSSTAIEDLLKVATGVAVSSAATPHLFDKLRANLFIGFAHNLLLESLVSRLAMLERQHPRAHALTLNARFKYHMAQANAREQRQAATMRSTTKGALKPKAKDLAEEGRALRCANRSKAQQLALAEDAVRVAYTFSNSQLFSRHVSRQWRMNRDLYNKAKTAIYTLKVESLRATHAVTAAGNTRRAAITLQERPC